MATPSFNDPTPDDDDNDDTQNFAPVPYKSRQIESSTKHQLSDLIESAKLAARLKARAMVSQEIQKGGPETVISTNLLDLSIDTILEEYTQKLSPEQLSLLAKEQNFSELETAFVNEYLATIKERVQAAKTSAKLYDDRTIAIRNVAIQDKLVFKELKPPELLRYLAVTRAMRELGITTDITMTNLEKMLPYVEDYCTHYNLSKEVNNGSTGPSF